MILLLFFQYHIENFFRYYFEMIIICDVYIRYWNNGMDLSNQVIVNTRVHAKKAPGTRIRANLCWIRIEMDYFLAYICVILTILVYSHTCVAVNYNWISEHMQSLILLANTFVVAFISMPMIVYTKQHISITWVRLVRVILELLAYA